MCSSIFVKLGGVVVVDGRQNYDAVVAMILLMRSNDDEEEEAAAVWYIHGRGKMHGQSLWLKRVGFVCVCSFFPKSSRGTRKARAPKAALELPVSICSLSSRKELSFLARSLLCIQRHFLMRTTCCIALNSYFVCH